MPTSSQKCLIIVLDVYIEDRKYRRKTKFIQLYEKSIFLNAQATVMLSNSEIAQMDMSVETTNGHLARLSFLGLSTTSYFGFSEISFQLNISNTRLDAP